ncbi:MAG TPA: hypothetical protein PKD26_15455 [Pyrinomonadaceae bacterium]|nr:hypothetical protein [Pyrinomonadaceae bacterium]
MTTTHKIYIAGAAGLIGAFLLVSLWSAHRMSQMERNSIQARAAAEKIEAAGIEAELRAAEYRKKIEYLEDELSAIRLIAAKQNEELKKLKINTDNARFDVGRARAVERIESSTAELCSKLAELGHPCE